MATPESGTRRLVPVLGGAFDFKHTELRERYMDPPQHLLKVTHEIAALPDPSSADAIEAHLRSHGPDLCPETLVYICREVLANGERSTFELAANLLLGVANGTELENGRCEPLIRRVARGMGLLGEPADLDDMRGWCFHTMLTAIKAGRDTPGHRMWEERFYVALKAAAIDAGRKVLRRRDKETPLDLIPLDSPRLSVDGAAEVFRNIERNHALRLIATLPEKARKAAYLHWVEGFPIESGDELKSDTVARKLGVSGRMVRKYLDQARGMLRHNDPRDAGEGI
jgi:DNA-directed RNA polymerase specialized sigma24 family protein